MSLTRSIPENDKCEFNPINVLKFAVAFLRGAIY